MPPRWDGLPAGVDSTIPESDALDRAVEAIDAAGGRCPCRLHPSRVHGGCAVPPGNIIFTQPSEPGALDDDASDRDG